MKKWLTAWLLSACMLFSACGGLTSQQSGTSENTQSSTSQEEENSQSSEDSSFEDSSSEGGEVEEEHVDEDDDGICDDCNQSVLVTIDFYSVNDLHGKLEDGTNHPGVDELSTYLNDRREENPNTVLLSAGDMWQGASASNLTKGHIITEWMNEMDFAAMALGNHEFDWGEEHVESNAELANFPFLALNIFDTATNERVDYCDASVLIECGGAKVGIIGAIGDCYSSISADKVENVYFKTGAELADLVIEEATNLRAQGADCIVYALHDDSSGCHSSISNYVDVVFEGHTHQSYVNVDGKGVYHLQGGGDNDGITHAQLSVNIANETAETETAKYIPNSVYKNLEDDPIVAEILDRYAEAIALAGKVLGYNEKYRSSWEILQKVADLYYEVGVETWGDEYDIVLGGGFMSARSPYELGVGDVTYGQLNDILPFDNPIVLCSISGAKLKSQFFENTTGRYYIAYGAYGEEVKNSILPTKTYYIVTDTYSSLYAPNGATEIARLDEKIFGRDLLASYIEEGGFGIKTEPIEVTIAEALAIGEALSVNEETTQRYIVEGRIIDTPNSTYGNVTIEDADGNQLYVWGMYDVNGVLYENMTDKPTTGDTVRLEGPLKYYNGTKVELYNSTLLSFTKASV